MRRKILLACGIAAPLLWIVADVVAAACWEGYSFASQTISELSAVGAPTRPLLTVTGIAYNVLLLAFAAGLWGAGRDARRLRNTGIVLAACAIASSLGPLFPMHLRGDAKSLTDLLHIAYAGVLVPLMLVSIGFGAGVRGRGFRIFSIGMIVTALAFGVLTGLQGPRVGENLPTPGLGVIERVTAWSFMAWVLALAVVLLRDERRRGAPAIVAGGSSVADGRSP